MAERPVFVPVERGPRLVDEVSIAFKWHPGMAPSQKKKNVVALHEAAALRGFKMLLEVSSKSEHEVGRRLSAFHLKTNVDGQEVPIECAFQGSKVFEHGGPFDDLLWVDSRTAKRDIRLRESGRLAGFRLSGRDYPLSPTTAFYDWLFISALFPHREWLERLRQFDGFTDIEFNPQRSLNCQARSCATFMALKKQDQLEHAAADFDSFKSILVRSAV